MDLQAANGLVEIVERVLGNGAAAAHVAGFQLFDGIVDEGQVGQDGSRDWNLRRLGLEMLPGQDAQEFIAKAANMGFDFMRLGRREIDHAAGKRRWRFCGMESRLDFAQQSVDVLAGDDEASLLRLVELAGAALIGSWFRHTSSRNGSHFECEWFGIRFGNRAGHDSAAEFPARSHHPSG